MSAPGPWSTARVREPWAAQHEAVSESPAPSRAGLRQLVPTGCSGPRSSLPLSQATVFFCEKHVPSLQSGGKESRNRACGMEVYLKSHHQGHQRLPTGLAQSALQSVRGRGPLAAVLCEAYCPRRGRSAEQRQPVRSSLLLRSDRGWLAVQCPVMLTPL